MYAVARSETTPADRLLWYQLGAGPAIVFAVVLLLLLGLNVIPRRMDQFSAVYPGANVKPAIKEFGFPQTALAKVSTESVNPTFDAAFPRPPSAVTIVYVLGGPKLKWSAATQAVSFDNGSQIWISQGSIGINVAACLAALLATFAVCKWWSNRRQASVATQS